MGKLGRPSTLISHLERLVVPSACAEAAPANRAMLSLAVWSVLGLVVTVGYLFLWIFILLVHARQTIIPALIQSAVVVAATAVASGIFRQVRREVQYVQQIATEQEKTQQALRASEERFRLIASATADYAFSARLNAQRQIEHSLLTGAFEAVTGYRPEEFDAIGGWHAIVHPDDREQVQREMSELKENRPVSIETRIVKKDGQIRWVQVHALPMWDEAARCLIGLNGGVLDITDRKRDEEALNESEKRYRIISEMISDYAYAYDICPDGSFTPFWITEASFRRMTGYHWNEIGATYHLYHPDDVERARQDMAATTRGQPTSAEYRIITKSGEVRWVYIHRRAEWGASGDRPARVYGAAQDITEHKRLEAALRAYTGQLESLVEQRTDALRGTKEQLELVLNHTGNALAFADSKGDILVSNPAYRTIFSEGATGAVERILQSFVTEDQIQLVSSALLKVIYDNEPQRIEAQITSDAKLPMDLDLHLIPVHTAEGSRHQGVLVSGYDITQLKEIERFKARFVADAVHDLATPIAGLSTRLYLLQHDPDRLAYHVGALQNQVHHLRNLLEDLRILSRLDRGQIVLKMEMCNLNDLVQRVFDTYEPVAMDKRQRFHLKTDPALPSVVLDPARIERVLVNLISNAVNYTRDQKAITIETAQEAQAVAIRVTDQGIGICAEDLPHVFERFYRSAEARQNVPGGTGLGLAITKEIVEMHGGSVSVTSTPGQGSTFTIRLPLPA